MGDAGRRIDKVDAVASADAGATYVAATQTLINELKAQVNDLLDKLTDAGLMEV